MSARVRLLARLSVANLRRNRWRWLLTISGIAIGVASFTGILAVSRSIIYAFEQSVVRTAGEAQLQVSNGSAGVAADLVERIKGLAGVEAASGTVQYEVLMPVVGRRLTIFGILFGADNTYRESQFGKDAVHISDLGYFVVQIDSVALSEELLDENGWSLGSRIDVVGPKGQRTLTVRGVLDSRGALSLFGGDVAVMDSDAAQYAFGKLDRFDWIDVVVSPGADLQATRQSVAQAVAGRAIVETPLGRGKRMETMLGTLRWLLTACGTAAMLVGVFLIQHTIATAMRRRRRELVTLRAIGATRWMVGCAILAEALILGAIGSLGGVAAGIAFAKVAVTPFGDAIGAMYTTLPPPPVTVTGAELAAAMAIGEGTVFLAALIPCIQLIRVRPQIDRPGLFSPGTPAPIPALAIAGASAIVAGLVAAYACRSFGFAGGVSMIALFAACLFLGTTLLVPAFLAALSPLISRRLRRTLGPLGTWTWQQILRHTYHTTTTMGALAAAVAFTVGLTTLLGSYRSAIAPWVTQTLAADVFMVAGNRFTLLPGPLIDSDLPTRLEEAPGVERVMPWRFVQVQFRGKPIIVQAAPQELIARWYEGVASDSRHVVISETLAERLRLDVGDTLRIPAPRAPLELRVAAVRPNYLLDLGSITIPWNAFVEHFGDSGANVLFIDGTSGTSSRELKRRIDELTSDRDLTILTGNELRAMANTLIDQGIGLTTALQFLAVLVTILAMINATSATILDRAFELATWRAIGLERGRLLGLLVLEAGLLGLLASILGIVAGAIMGSMLVRVIAPVVAGFRLPLSWPVVWALVVVAATTAVAAATAWFVARSQMPRPIFVRDARA